MRGTTPADRRGVALTLPNGSLDNPSLRFGGERSGLARLGGGTLAFSVNRFLALGISETDLLVRSNTLAPVVSPLALDRANATVVDGEETTLDVQELGIPVTRLAAYRETISRWGWKFYGFNASLNTQPILQLSGSGSVLVPGSLAVQGITALAGETHIGGLPGSSLSVDAPATFLQPVTLSGGLTINAPTGLTPPIGIGGPGISGTLLSLYPTTTQLGFIQGGTVNHGITLANAAPGGTPTAGATIGFSPTGTGFLFGGNNSLSIYTTGVSAGAILLGTAGVVRMTIPTAGNIAIQTGLGVSGALGVGGGFISGGTTITGGAIQANGTISTPGAIQGGAITGTSLSAGAGLISTTGAATIGGTLVVTGLLTATGGLTTPVGANASIGGTLTATGLLTATGGLTTPVGANANIGGTLTATGLITGNGGLTITGLVTLPNGSITQAAIGSLTIAEAAPAAGSAGDTALIGVLLNNLAHRTMSIIGGADWKDAIPANSTLTNLDTRVTAAQTTAGHAHPYAASAHTTSADHDPRYSLIHSHPYAPSTHPASSDHDALYVNVGGDTMSGPLNMGAQTLTCGPINAGAINGSTVVGANGVSTGTIFSWGSARLDVIAAGHVRWYHTSSGASVVLRADNAVFQPEADAGTYLGFAGIRWNNLYTMNIAVGLPGHPSYQIHLGADSAGKPTSNVWTVTSDRRTKVAESIKPYTDGLDTLLSLRPVRYRYNGLAQTEGAMDEDCIGFLAEEAQQVAPDLVRSVRMKLRQDDEDEADVLGVNTHALTFMFINAFRAMNERLQKLEEALA